MLCQMGLHSVNAPGLKSEAQNVMLSAEPSERRKDLENLYLLVRNHLEQIFPPDDTPKRARQPWVRRATYASSLGLLASQVCR